MLAGFAAVWMNYKAKLSIAVADLRTLRHVPKHIFGIL